MWGENAAGTCGRLNEHFPNQRLNQHFPNHPQLGGAGGAGGAGGGGDAHLHRGAANAHSWPQRAAHNWPQTQQARRSMKTLFKALLSLYEDSI